MSVCMQYLEEWRSSKDPRLIYLQKDGGMQY